MIMEEHIPEHEPQKQRSLFNLAIHYLSTWFYPFGLAIAGLLIWVVRWTVSTRRKILRHISLQSLHIKE